MHISKRGLVALIVSITILASSLPFIIGSNSNEDMVAAPVISDTGLMESIVPSNPSAPDSRAIFEMAANSGVPSEYVYLPNILAQGLNGNGIIPQYSASPAPMGITDYGFMEPSGLKIPYQYNTSGFVATVMFESLDAQYIMNSNPGTVAVQLSSVLSVPSVQGNVNSFFWIKNIMLYTPSTGEVQFVANVWDLSYPSLAFPGGAIQSGNGTMIPGLMYYYAGPVIELQGENSVALYVTAGAVGGNNAVFFQYSSGTGEHGDAAPGITYDTVVLSSPAPSGANAGGRFIVDGFSKTPSGFLKDVELAVTGPGMGSTTSIYDANGQLTLKFMGADGTYTKLPAAYNYGSNTGETVQGLSVWWSSQMKPMAHLSTGPSLPVSLWGSLVSHSGAVNLQGTIDPANAFVFINMGTLIDNGTAAWAPVNSNGTYKYSLPGRITYTMEVLLSNYEPQYVTVATSANESSDEGTGQSHGGGGGGEGADETQAWNNFTLAANVSLGVYTPLYADGNGQLKSLTIGASGTGSTVGNGTIADPYVLENNQLTRISELFTRANNFLYPQFSGLMIENSNSYVKIDSPPSFQYKYPVSSYNLLNSMQLPFYNNLNMIFYNTAGITVSNATSITGWFPDTMNSPILSSLMFVDSTDFLIASNTFSSMGSSLSIYSSNGASGNGTVWGNEFAGDLVLGSSYASAMLDHADPLGISVFNSGNLIYNNYFGQGINVTSPLHDPYTHQPIVYRNAWNLPVKMETSFVNWVNGHSMTGVIVGCGYQGGNYWQYRDVSQTPFNEGGKIAYGGDYIPLTPPAYPVSFNASGSLPIMGWQVQIIHKAQMAYNEPDGNPFMVNGTYGYRIITDSSYSASPSSGTFTIDGKGQSINITFSKVAYPVTFTRTGIPEGTTWTLAIGNNIETVQNSSITLYLQNGTYDYSASVKASGLLASDSGKVLLMGGPLQQYIVLQNQLHRVNFVMNSGSIAGQWNLTLNGVNYSSTSLNITSAVQNGVYEYTVIAPSGYVVTPSSGTVMVYDGNVTIFMSASVQTYKVTFVGDGLKSGTLWQVQFGGQAINTTGPEIAFDVPAGNYTYYIPGVSNYTNNLNSGYILVSGENITLNVGFEVPVDFLGGALNVLIGTVSFAAISGLATYFVGKRK